MADPWLPIGFEIARDARVAGVVAAGIDWQICALSHGGRALLAAPPLADRWEVCGLLDAGATSKLTFGDRTFTAIEAGPNYTLGVVSSCRSPNNKVEALAFAAAIKATRSFDKDSSLQGGVYVERLSRILPTYESDDQADDAMILGSWLTGGLRVPAVPIKGLKAILTWLPPDGLSDVVSTAGLAVLDTQGLTDELEGEQDTLPARGSMGVGRFTLPGRPALETFFNDHVVDIVQNLEHYKAMGIGNPGAIILEGPPGCGKTFAADKLIDFLGWPRFSIDAGSIGSPYIHETSRKVGDVFSRAIESSPSVVVIDEMEAFVSERDAAGGGHHRIEEVAEFLRRIPEAVAAGVLVIGMTNKIGMIDAAIQRRGRFDHIVHVEFASEEEILELLTALLSSRPTADDVDIGHLARRLAGRPLSDVDFVVRESARIAAKARLPSINMASFATALASIPRNEGGNKIGFL